MLRSYIIGPRVIWNTSRVLGIPTRRNFHATILKRKEEFEITEESLKNLGEKNEIHHEDLESEFLSAFEGEEVPEEKMKLGKEVKETEEIEETPRIMPSPFITRSSDSVLSEYLKQHESEPIEEVEEGEEEEEEYTTPLPELEKYGNLLQPTPKKDSVIILNTKNIYSGRKKKYGQPRSENGRPSHLSVYDIMKDKDNSKTSRTDTEEFFQAIESLRPKSSQLYGKQYDKNVQNMSRMFTKDQLKLYARNHSALNGTSKFKKIELSDYIFSKIWGIVKLDTVNNTKELMSEEIIPLNTRDLKLLLSNSGVIIFNWRSFGADIAIDAFQRMIIRARGTVVKYIKVMMNNMLEKTKTAQLDLSRFQTIGENKKLLDYLGSITNVVWEKNDNTLSLFSLMDHRISTFKQLLLLSLQNNTENKYIVNKEVNKIAINDTLSIPDIYNYKKWYRYQSDKKRVNNATEDIFDDIEDYETINEEIKDLMVEQLKLEPLLEDIKLKLFDKNFEESVRNFKDVETIEVENESQEFEGLEIESNIDTGVVDVDMVYDELPNDGFFTSTFGYILTDADLETQFFNSHIPSMNKVIAEMPLYQDKSAPDKDNFDYLYVVKLIPDPFKNCDNIKRHLPIEFWFETSGKFLDTKSLRILQTSEKNVSYSLPDYKSDLKLSSSKTIDIDTNFEQIDWLSDQPDILNFLQNSEISVIDFKDSNFKDSVKINIEGEEIDYLVVGTQQRRQLELKFNSQLLQYSIIDNGYYGGKRLEVNLVGNLHNETMTRTNFAKFVSNSLEFIKTL